MCLHRICQYFMNTENDMLTQSSREPNSISAQLDMTVNFNGKALFSFSGNVLNKLINII